MTADVLRNGGGDGADIIICAFASREQRFGDLGRGIFCSQGFGKPPLLVGLVTKMADVSNGNRFPPSISIPSAFVNLESEYKMEKRLMTGTDAEQGDYPYAVSIWSSGIIHQCNGALIGPKHVLTVKTCVMNWIRGPSNLLCKIGDIYINDDDEKGPDAEELAASKIIAFRRGRDEPDVNLAIIVLEAESKLTPILLPDAGQPN